MIIIYSFPFIQFMKSVVCQAHLSPLPLHVSPVYWSHDNALRLYPLPDLVVFGDKYDPYTVTTAGCIGTNTVCLKTDM